MLDFCYEYIAVGGNRHPSAADWDPLSGLLAFGADVNVALWFPLDEQSQGIQALLHGHTDPVNVVRFFPTARGQSQIILSGSTDRTIRIWQAQSAVPLTFDSVATLEGHSSSVNSLAVSHDIDLIASGSADSTIKIWRLNIKDDGVSTVLLQTIQTNPRFFSLALALHKLPAAEDLVLAVAGTKGFVQIYVALKGEQFLHQATLTGHEGWIRSLAITQENLSTGSDLLLASASQDKYIRLWRITKVRDESKTEESGLLRVFEQSLSNKAHKLKAAYKSYSVTFEALLLGHEDWIYTVSWHLQHDCLQLLSASADNSLAIWRSEVSSGIWVCTTRLGEISAQKGSTTATGSTGGFWIGLWCPSGKAVVSLGRTGSWRLWDYDASQARWIQGIGISGHIKPVADVAWSKNGSYLLSTGSDQTTRLHAEWERGVKRSWHEMARPQIHGYNLNCIDSINRTQFISGADEKLLRVFDEPRATADVLDNLCGIQTSTRNSLPFAADIPVLGLSNKAVEKIEDAEHAVNRDLSGEEAAMSQCHAQALDPEHPPLEDQLARHTLWPEHEKLYGHGYEISAVGASHDGSLVATSCRASSLNHAVIRLYASKDWREIRPSLTIHSLSVTALCFSKDDRYLLSVGRDRQWAISERDATVPERYRLKHTNPKGHSRMILAACWAPVKAGRVFATAGRDKSVKIWSMIDATVECMLKIMAPASLTAVDIFPQLLQDSLIVAVGMETGDLGLRIVKLSHWSIEQEHELRTALQPAKLISKLSWRPWQAADAANETGDQDRGLKPLLIATASDDSSLRLFSITGLLDDRVSIHE